MNLFLWRHAEAEAGRHDLARSLTPRGRHQADRIATWLKQQELDRLRIVVSPAKRTCQTADALERRYEILNSLAPGASPESVLAEVGWPTAGGNVLVVGHQPWLGRVAALILTGQPLYWSVPKAGLWWLATQPPDGDADVVVRAVLSPETL